MRIRGALFLLLALSGFSAGQDTNFPVGPQYLMNYGSPLFARPIATPSLTFDTPTQSAVAATPSSSSEAFATVPELEHQADLFPIYYGVPRVSVIEISYREPAERRPTLPLSIVNSGVAESTDAASLRVRGFGVTLGEAAGYWKINKAHARHLYTNEDIRRLPPRE